MAAVVFTLPCRHGIYWGNDIWRRASPVLQRSVPTPVLWLYNIPSSTTGDTRPVARSSSVTLLIICPLPTLGYVVDETFSRYFASGSKNVIVYHVNTQSTIKLYYTIQPILSCLEIRTNYKRRRALTRWLTEQATVTVRDVSFISIGQG